MVNAGLLPAIVVDNYIATVLEAGLPGLDIHDSMPLRSGGVLAVAIRKNSPELMRDLNAFIAKQGLDSAFGAILNKRYLQSTKFVKNATSEAERRKFAALIDLFRKYGDRYKFDYLLMAAQGYQESRLDQQAKSPVGAIGVMQLMPETGREQKVGDVRKIDPNVHAGVKVHALHQGLVLRERADGRSEQGTLHLRGLQRRSRAGPAAAAGGEAARA
jgi:membrane-bound lytic murein transglycosylase MltF